jgi:hypothetical protein
MSAPQSFLVARSWLALSILAVMAVLLFVGWSTGTIGGVLDTVGESWRQATAWAR